MADVNGDRIVGIFLGAFAAMVKVFLTCAVGVLAAIYPKGDPLMPDVALRNFSRLFTFVLFPPLIVVALGSSLSPSLLAEYIILIPFCFVNMLTSFLAFLLLQPLHQEGKAFRTASMVATMSPNIISMPLMLLQSLCELSLVNDDYDGESGDCFEDATSVLFVYSIGFNLLYWAVLYPILMDVAEDINNPEDEVADNASVESRVLTKWHHLEAFATKGKVALSRVLMTPAMIGIYVGLFIGLVPGLRGLVFGETVSPLTPVGGTLRVLAAPVVCLNTLIMAASLAKVQLPPSILEKFECIRRAFSCGSSKESENDSSLKSKPVFKHVREKSRRFKRHVLKRMGLHHKRELKWTDMDASAVVTGVEFVETDANGYVINEDEEKYNTDKAVEGSSQLCRDAGCAVGTPEGAESAIVPAEKTTTHEFNGTENTSDVAKLDEDEPVVVTGKTLLVHVLARSIFPPIIAIVLLRLAIHGGVISASSRMMQLVVVVEAANPSAQLVVVCLNQLGVPELASQMSLVFVGQYVLSIVTLTFWTSVGMSMIYSD